eukprot:1853517-Pyramimonas_sp.AAC.1
MALETPNRPVRRSKKGFKLAQEATSTLRCLMFSSSCCTRVRLESSSSRVAAPSIGKVVEAAVGTAVLARARCR